MFCNSPVFVEVTQLLAIISNDVGMQEATMILKHEAKINEGNKDTRFCLFYLSVVVFWGTKDPAVPLSQGIACRERAWSGNGCIYKTIIKCTIIPKMYIG